ncbi:MAG: hypothetical protein WAL45_17965 [Terracidiphilus sp.]
MMATLCSYQVMFGPCHLQTLGMATLLAEALCSCGERALGKRLLERAVRDLSAHHGRYHPARLRALEAWSKILRQEEDWYNALAVQRELLDCRDHVLGPDAPEAVAARNELSATAACLLNEPMRVSA